MNWGTLTGRVRFRPALWGRVILQVQYVWHGIGPGERPSPERIRKDRFDWRDADPMDLSHPTLRWMIDSEPHHQPPRPPSLLSTFHNAVK